MNSSIRSDGSRRTWKISTLGRSLTRRDNQIPSTSSDRERYDSHRFQGQGITFKGKLIGVLAVPEARGDRMCQDALSELKMAVRAAGEHKQRIALSISVDGLRMRDERSGDCLYHHHVHKISFIAQDMSDKRSFGYVFGSPDSGHQFFGVKTEKDAGQVVMAMRDLFQVVFELKKIEMEKKKQKLVDDHLKKNGNTSISRRSSGRQRAGDITASAGPAWALGRSALMKDAVSSLSLQSGHSLDLLDLQLEIENIEQGISQMTQRLSPSESCVSAAAAPCDDSPSINSDREVVSAPPPQHNPVCSSAEPSPRLQRRTRATSSAGSAAAPAVIPPPPVSVKSRHSSSSSARAVAHQQPSRVALSETASSDSADIFTELDPLGSGRVKPYIDKKDFFSDLKKPRVRLSDLSLNFSQQPQHSASTGIDKQMLMKLYQSEQSSAVQTEGFEDDFTAVQVNGNGACSTGFESNFVDALPDVEAAELTSPPAAGFPSDFSVFDFSSVEEAETASRAESPPPFSPPPVPLPPPPCRRSAAESGAHESLPPPPPPRPPHAQPPPPLPPKRAPSHVQLRPPLARAAAASDRYSPLMSRSARLPPSSADWPPLPVPVRRTPRYGVADLPTHAEHSVASCTSSASPPPINRLMKERAGPTVGNNNQPPLMSSDLLAQLQSASLTDLAARLGVSVERLTQMSVIELAGCLASSPTPAVDAACRPVCPQQLHRVSPEESPSEEFKSLSPVSSPEVSIYRSPQLRRRDVAHAHSLGTDDDDDDVFARFDARFPRSPAPPPHTQSPLSQCQSPPHPQSQYRSPPHPQSHYQSPPHPQSQYQSPPHPQSHSQSPPHPQSHSQSPPHPQSQYQSPPHPQSHSQSPPHPQSHSQSPPQPQSQYQSPPKSVCSAAPPAVDRYAVLRELQAELTGDSRRPEQSQPTASGAESQFSSSATTESQPSSSDSQQTGGVLFQPVERQHSDGSDPWQQAETSPTPTAADAISAADAPQPASPRLFDDDFSRINGSDGETPTDVNCGGWTAQFDSDWAAPPQTGADEASVSVAGKSPRLVGRHASSDPWTAAPAAFASFDEPATSTLATGGASGCAFDAIVEATTAAAVGVVSDSLKLSRAQMAAPATFSSFDDQPVAAVTTASACSSARPAGTDRWDPERQSSNSSSTTLQPADNSQDPFADDDFFASVEGSVQEDPFQRDPFERNWAAEFNATRTRPQN